MQNFTLGFNFHYHFITKIFQFKNFIFNGFVYLLFTKHLAHNNKKNIHSKSNIPYHIKWIF